MITTENIWAEYRSALKGFLHKRVSNPADVDDLLQDILLKTHLHLNELQSQDSIRVWSYLASKNYLVQYSTMRSPSCADLEERSAKLGAAYDKVKRHLGRPRSSVATLWGWLTWRSWCCCT